jgi:cellulose synthase/poly-beta-1,6-N-acetylglucosamine synthase-like glycosyltransferase
VNPQAAQTPLAAASARAGARSLTFPLLLGSVALLLLAAVLAAFFGRGPWAWSIGVVYIAYDTWLLSHMVRASRRSIQEAARGALLPPATNAGGARPSMAVVISARDERAALPATLAHLLAQRDLPDRILLVDDGSTDGTQEWLTQSYSLAFDKGGPLGRSLAEPRLWVLQKPNSGKARSLNRALELLTEDVVLTLDADTHLDPGALAAVRAAFAREPGLWAACGVLLPTCKNGRYAKAYQLYQTFEYLRGFLWRLSWMRERTLVLVSGAFAAFRRAQLTQVGGFDPECRVEDYELLFRLHRLAGDTGSEMTVRVLSEARATTDAPGKLSNFLNQRRRWFAGFIQTMFRHHDMVGNPRYGRLGTFHLLVKTVDTLLPVYGLIALLSLPLLLLSGKPIATPLLVLAGAKFLFDLTCHASCVIMYQRWLGLPASPGLLARSLFASFTEPLAFQLLRQLGAVLGWVSFLRGRIDWTPQRAAVVPDSRELVDQA